MMILHQHNSLVPPRDEGVVLMEYHHTPIWSSSSLVGVGGSCLGQVSIDRRWTLPSTGGGQTVVENITIHGITISEVTANYGYARYTGVCERLDQLRRYVLCCVRKVVFVGVSE